MVNINISKSWSILLMFEGLVYPIEIFIVLRDRRKSTARTIPVMMAITPRAIPAWSVELNISGC